ncbi:unnamed protein product [Mytilus coruscus]|uniref:CCHC-type domain-containing protein n=1 Tax=Mytilus coruscus TaxID=42192 RepID=A0A6J8B5T6_MYTCO|nr:unnamed protein product [Mytilus coruscus]
MIDVDEQDDCQQMSSIMDRIAKIESNRRPNQSQKTDFLCYFCGKAGHFKRDCRKFLDMQKNGKYLPNNRFETSKWSQGTQTENYTGSTLTVIHVRKFLSIPESQRPDKIYKGVQLKLANGEIITTFGQADFDIEINDHKFQQRFVIADIDAPTIVGYKFLYNKDCKIDIRLLQKHSNAFAKSKNDLGCTDMIQHKINTGNAAPVKQNPRCLPVAMQEAADRELSRMLDARVIEPSMSPWAAPIVLVRKKDGSVRYCIDF